MVASISGIKKEETASLILDYLNYYELSIGKSSNLEVVIEDVILSFVKLNYSFIFH